MKLSKTKRILIGFGTIFFVIFGIPFIATLGSITWVKLTSPPPLLRETADTTPVHVQLGGKDFMIPSNYFNKPYSERSRREQTALIHAHWPDMSGSTKETIERRKKYRGHLNRITILIEGTPVTIDLSAARLKIYKKWSKSDGFKKFKDPQIKFGLTYHENVFEKPAGSGSIEDIYVDDPNRPSAVITCTGVNEKKIPSPSCRHYFDYKGLRLNANYTRDYLPEWKEIQNSVERLIDRFAEDYTRIYPSSNKGD